MAKVTYIKCPRCELNYIDSALDMCDICKAELGLIKSLDSEEESGYEEGIYYCSVCKRVAVAGEDDICDACAAKMEIEPADPLIEDDESWRKEYIDDDPVAEEPIEIPLEELQDEEYDAVYDDEEEVVPDAYEDDEFEEADLDGDLDFDDEEDIDEDLEEEEE